MLKRAIRGGLSRFSSWLERDANHTAPQPYEKDFGYPGLNAILSEMMAEGVRVPYAWGMLQGVSLASALGLERVSVVEFGVAGGNGLVAMEQIATTIERRFPVNIEIYGFDTGVGLPAVDNVHDMPNLASGGLYTMDEARLRGRLSRSQLVLGDIRDTMPSFLASRPAPLAFLACDLILYSATTSALGILDADEGMLLPRIPCYFDDVLGFTYGDHNGERLAIHEFNAAHPNRKVDPMFGLRHYVPARCFNDMWVEKYWFAHIFDHSKYAQRDNLVKQHDLSLAH